MKKVTSFTVLVSVICALGMTALSGCGNQKNQNNPIGQGSISIPSAIGMGGVGIVGGDAVQSTDPVALSTVALYADLSSASKTDFFNFCTGTLIARDLVITAAHCIVDFSHELHGTPESLKRIVKVGFGLAVVSNPQDTHVVFRNIKNLRTHEGYVMGAVDSALDKPLMDIALIQLDQPAPDFARPAALPSTANVLSHGTLITIAGFGLTDGRAKTEAIRMNKTTIQVDNENASASQFTYRVVDRKSACNGDSGGPAYLVSPYGQVTVVGVTSWGDGNCVHMGAYTKVGAFLSWLSQTANAFHSWN